MTRAEYVRGLIAAMRGQSPPRCFTAPTVPVRVTLDGSEIARVGAGRDAHVVLTLDHDAVTKSIVQVGLDAQARR